MDSFDAIYSKMLDNHFFDSNTHTLTNIKETPEERKKREDFIKNYQWPDISKPSYDRPIGPPQVNPAYAASPWVPETIPADQERGLKVPSVFEVMGWWK